MTDVRDAEPGEVEIQTIPALTPEEERRLQAHTLCNLVNAIVSEARFLGLILFRDEGRFAMAIAEAEALGRLEPARADAETCAAEVKRAERVVLDELVRLAGGHPDYFTPTVQEGIENVRLVFDYLKVRTAELAAYSRQPDRWLRYPVRVLTAELQGFLSALQRYSHNRFGVVYEQSLQHERDYWVQFQVAGPNGAIAMPGALKDALRDLVANARKYSSPGARIRIQLEESGGHLLMAVEDDGIGIPPGEIERVVEFGRRGSNVAGYRTLGGGFGLTKAFVNTKRFGGRFFIRSELGHGTRIRIVVPHPAPPG